MKQPPVTSPNYNDRPDGTALDMLVLHYTGMQSGAAAISRLCDPEAKVSAHYVVEEDGRVFALVPEEKRAWHAGVSHWRGQGDVNSRSIGIEIVNPGHEFGYRDFPEAQMAAVSLLCRQILHRHPAIVPQNVVAHSDIAPDRKEDPGERFDWARLAAEGVGLWPGNPAPLDHPALSLGDNGEAVEKLQRELAHFGYGIVLSARYDVATEQVVTAFQRRFRSSLFNGEWDGDCAARLAALLKMI